MGSRGEIEVDQSGGLSEVFRALSPWLRRSIASRFGVAAPDAEDLVQESFLRFRRCDPTERRRHPKALLMRIAGNLVRDAIRREKARGREHSVSFDEHRLEDRLCVAAEQHELAAVRAIVMGLPEPQRTVFLLARFTPMTNAEIGRRLGISVKTVEWRLARATAACLSGLTD